MATLTMTKMDRHFEILFSPPQTLLESLSFFSSFLSFFAKLVLLYILKRTPKWDSCWISLSTSVIDAGNVVHIIVEAESTKLVEVMMALTEAWSKVASEPSRGIRRTRRRDTPRWGRWRVIGCWHWWGIPMTSKKYSEALVGDKQMAFRWCVCFEAKIISLVPSVDCAWWSKSHIQ